MKFTVRDLVQIALVTALYVIFTAMPPFNAISYGVLQFRLSEMLGFLAFYKPKYIIALTLGCILANFNSSLGLIDVVVGSLQTLIFTSLGVYLFRKHMGQKILGYNKAFLFFSLLYAFTMFTIAGELTYVTHVPFLATWATTALGELISLLIGGYIISLLAKRVDLSK